MGCPWDEETMQRRMAMLQFAGGMPLKRKDVQAAAKHGDLKVLWLRENGCPWSGWTSHEAVQRGDWEMAKWAVEHPMFIFSSSVWPWESVLQNCEEGTTGRAATTTKNGS